MAEPEEKRRLSDQPAMLISRAARYLWRLADARFRELGISAGQIPVLVALKNGEKLSQKELVRIAEVEQSSMAQMLARMERDGLIVREVDPRDRRASLVALSPKALEVLLPGRGVLFRGNDEAMDGFSPEDSELLVSLLRRVLNNLSRPTDTSHCKAPYSEDLGV